MSHREGEMPRGPKDTEDSIELRREVTKVTDIPSMYRKLEKLDSLLQRTADHVVSLPEIKTQVESINTKVEILDNRVDRVERQLDHGHDCYQVDVIAKITENGMKSAADLQDDIQSGIKVTEKLNYIERDVKLIQGSRKWLIGVAVGLVFPILGSIGSAIWLVASLKARIDVQEEVQRTNFSRVEKTIKTTNQQQVQAIRGIDDQITNVSIANTSKATDVREQEWYRGLTKQEKQRLDLAIKRMSE